MSRRARKREDAMESKRYQPEPEPMDDEDEQQEEHDDGSQDDRR